MTDLLIVGGGAAGLTAAIYARRAGLQFVLLEQDGCGGGQIQTTDRVDNYPGLYGIDGMELAEKLTEHCRSMDVSIRSETVTEVRLTDGGRFLVITDASELEARSVIYAAGAVARKLDVPGAETFAGRGVSTCAACDGAFFSGEDVAVVGGGDTAASDALYLSRLCRTVHVLYRRNSMRAAQLLQERLQAAENIILHPETQLLELTGDEQLRSARIRTGSTERILPVGGVFAAIGTQPATEPLAGLGVCDADGLITAGETGATSIPGLYVAGDIRRKSLRQVLTAAADGANAASAAAAWLLENP